MLDAFQFANPTYFCGPVTRTFTRLSYVKTIVSICLSASKCYSGPRCVISMCKVAAFNRFRVRSFRILIGGRCVFFDSYYFICLILRIMFFYATVNRLVAFTIPLLLFSMFVRGVICIRCLVNGLLVGLYRILRSRTFSWTRRRDFIMFRLPILRLTFRNLFNGVILAHCRLLRNLAGLDANF